MMNKKDIYNYLNDRNIWYEITEHEAVYTMDEVSKIKIPYPESEAKNIFVRDDKKINYYLITIRGNKRVDLKKFRGENKTRPLSFASQDELMSIMKLTPGSVTPFGILNDTTIKVQVFLDKEFITESAIIGVHPNDNTATIWLKTEDLVNIMKEHGNPIHIVEI